MYEYKRTCINTGLTQNSSKMANEPEKWLKRQYEEDQDPISSTGPMQTLETKKVKFSEIHDRICTQFPALNFTQQTTSSLISNIFPNTSRKRIGTHRETYVTGIGPLDSDQSEIEQLRKQVTQLQQRVQQLEQSNSATLSMQTLQIQIATLMNPDNSVFHGPDTTQHFKDFSIDEILSELRTQAPNVYQLQSELAIMSRHTVDSSTPVPKVNQQKILTSFISLLKGRSMRVLGI